MSTPTIKKGRPYFQFADSNGRAREYSSRAAAIRAAKRDYPEAAQPTIYRVDYAISSDGYIFGELYTPNLSTGKTMKLEPKKTETFASTLEDLLHAVNLLGEDRDILVDGYDIIAVCPPVRLTPEGREHFKDALSAKVVVLYGEYSCFGSYVSDDSDKTNREAYDLLESLAGYCLDSEFSRWFEGPKATFI